MTVPSADQAPETVMALLYSEQPGRLMLTVPEVAPLLHLSISAAYEAARRGDFPTRRVGRRVLVPVPLLREWLGVAVLPHEQDGPGDGTVVRLFAGEEV